MNGGCLDWGTRTTKVLRSKVCPPTLGTRVPTVRTPNWSRPVGVHPAKPCLTVLPYP